MNLIWRRDAAKEPCRFNTPSAPRYRGGYQLRSREPVMPNDMPGVTANLWMH